jgi:hypothetical protein
MTSIIQAPTTNEGKEMYTMFVEGPQHKYVLGIPHF